MSRQRPRTAPRASSNAPRPRAAATASKYVATSSRPRPTGRPHVSGLTVPRQALVGTGFPFKNLPLLRRYLDQFAAIMGATSGIRRAGAAALDLVDVAAGRLDCFWELTLAPWDVAAGVVLVREAGGVVTTLDGSPDVLQHGSVVAGNPTLHKWLMGLLRSA